MNRRELRAAVSTALERARRAAPLPAAAVASALVGAAASGAPGDLDPAFADVGRAYPLPDLDGPAWSVQLQGEDDFILAGGDHYAAYYYYYYDDLATGFTQRRSGDGSIDQSFAALSLAETEVLDVVVQSDGKVIGVGRTVQGAPSHFVLTVFRLDIDGALDPGFGEGGIVHVGAGSTSDMAGTSVVLDTDGRIVVAGQSGTWSGAVIVARFLANGTLDAAFGVDGVFTGPVTQGYIAYPQVVRTSDGGFRVTTNRQRPIPISGQSAQFCSVVGLTAAGALDPTFGEAGLASIPATGPSQVTCSALAGQQDGGLLVAGSDEGHGMLVRLVTNGSLDADYSAPLVAAGMDEATALGTGGSGSILVAGRGAAGVSGALVVRLQAGGQLDTVFGKGGSTWIDLPLAPSDNRTEQRVHDLAVLADGGVLLAGGAYGQSYNYYRYAQPFVARLLGSGGGDGPGVLGIERHYLSVTEQGQDAILAVRRMGGASGAVSIAYETRVTAGGAGGATPGEDYTTVSGRLEWADGDAGDKQITVPIAADDSIEAAESFSVVLQDLQGNAGLGTGAATVQIVDPGYIGSVFVDGGATVLVDEGVGHAEFSVHLVANSPAAVSVTLAMTPGSAAAGLDYVADPITVSWPAGSSGQKLVRVPIIEDDFDESSESFTVTLVDPTEGVILGSPATATITIRDNDRNSSGGGSFGFASWLLLATLGWMRLRPRVRDRARGRWTA